MGKTIAQYLNLDGYGRKADGTDITHKEKYETLVNDIGLHNLVPLMPASKDAMTAALAADEHLNSIPLKYWDSRTGAARQHLSYIGITSTSLADGVCLLKAAARMWVEEE
jgi:hypothetical protein